MTINKWTHSICQKCWDERRPEQPPAKLIKPLRRVVKCCFCFEYNQDGIFVINDPDFLGCIHEAKKGELK